jgi:hypothetical protein
LTDLLREGAKMLEWTASALEAFQNAKCHLAWPYTSNNPPHMLNFLLPLMPLILISARHAAEI